MVDDDRTTGGEADLALEGGLDLGFDLVTGKQRNAILIQFQLVEVLRHHLFHELPGLLVDLRVIDQDFIDVVTQVVADGTDGDTAFLIDQECGLALLGGLFDGLPDLAQVIHIPLQFLGTLAYPCGAHDNPHVIRDTEMAHRIADLATIITLDAARYTTGAGVIGHQYQIAPRQADEGGQGRALVATFFLVDLDNDFLSFTQNLLDIDAARDLDRWIEVLAGDFLHGQEAMSLGAVIDKGGFQTRLDAGDAPFVNIGFFLFAGGTFDIQIVQLLAIDHGNTQLLRLSCVK